MPTPKQVVACVSEVLGVPLGTVRQHDRNLVDFGVREAASRGRGVAEASTKDAASLVVAVSGSRSVKDSAKTVARFSSVVRQLESAIRAAIKNDEKPFEDFNLTLDSSGDLVETRRFTEATVRAVAGLFKN